MEAKEDHKELAYYSDRLCQYRDSCVCCYQMGESMGKAMLGLVK